MNSAVFFGTLIGITIHPLSLIAMLVIAFLPNWKLRGGAVVAGAIILSIETYLRSVSQAARLDMGPIAPPAAYIPLYVISLGLAAVVGAALRDALAKR